MDRKNLVHDNFTMKIVLHWRLLLEKYGPTIKYIKRSDNDAVYDFISIPLNEYDVIESKIRKVYFILKILCW